MLLTNIRPKIVWQQCPPVLEYLNERIVYFVHIDRLTLNSAMGQVDPQIVYNGPSAAVESLPLEGSSFADAVVGKKRATTW